MRPTMCLCGKPPGYNRYMIFCDGCKYWLHANCVGVTKGQRLPEKWYCPRCTCVPPTVTKESKAMRSLTEEFCALKKCVEEMLGHMRKAQKQEVEVAKLIAELTAAKEIFLQQEQTQNSDRRAFEEIIRKQDQEVDKLKADLTVAKEMCSEQEQIWNTDKSVFVETISKLEEEVAKLKTDLKAAKEISLEQEQTWNTSRKALEETICKQGKEIAKLKADLTVAKTCSNQIMENGKIQFEASSSTEKPVINLLKHANVKVSKLSLKRKASSQPVKGVADDEIFDPDIFKPRKKPCLSKKASK